MKTNLKVYPFSLKGRNRFLSNCLENLFPAESKKATVSCLAECFGTRDISASQKNRQRCRPKKKQERLKSRNNIQSSKTKSLSLGSAKPRTQNPGPSQYNRRGLKGQTMLITLVLVLLITIGTITFLVSTVQIFRGEDYVKLHANSLVTSMLKTDTGFGGDIEKCKTLADIFFCAETTPSWRCADTRCEEIADSLTDLYIQKALDPKLEYSFQYGDKKTPLSKDLGNRTGIYKVNQKISKRGQDVDILFIVAEKK